MNKMPKEIWAVPYSTDLQDGEWDTTQWIPCPFVKNDKRPEGETKYTRTDIHQARVQELLESNNALLERARKAEECVQAAIKHLEISIPSGLEFSALYQILKR